MAKGYSIDKVRKNDIAYINCDRINGFKFNPKNKVKHNGIKVDQMVVINSSFVERVLKKKIKRKLDLYLEYVVSLTDNDDDANHDKIQMAMNDLARYKSIIKRKYRMYLDERYVELLLKKIALIEYELKTKMYYIDEYEYEEEKGRSR